MFKCRLQEKFHLDRQHLEDTTKLQIMRIVEKSETAKEKQKQKEEAAAKKGKKGSSKNLLGDPLADLSQTFPAANVLNSAKQEDEVSVLARGLVIDQ